MERGSKIGVGKGVFFLRRVCNYIEMGTVSHYGILKATVILVQFVYCLTEQASRFEILLFS